jgi:hypothetical protein
MPETIDDKLNEGLQLRGMSVEQFAALAAIYNIPKASKAKLYESFRGGKALDNETAVSLWKLWEEIEAMCYEALPWPVDLSNAKRVDTCLQIYRGCAALKGKENESNSNDGDRVPHAS